MRVATCAAWGHKVIPESEPRASDSNHPTGRVAVASLHGAQAPGSGVVSAAPENASLSLPGPETSLETDVFPSNQDLV